MAVHTALSPEVFTRVADIFGLGSVRSVTPIPQGSINTNHRLETDTGRYFVRHTTVRSSDDLRFESALLAHLAAYHFPSPVQLTTRDGATFVELEGGRVSVFRWLPGEELRHPNLTSEHLERLGTELGKLHRDTQSFSGSRTNPYSPDVVRGWLAELSRHPDATLATIAGELERLLDTAESQRLGLEPLGVIHADLFTDNVKWLGGSVGAFFDFEMACREAYGLDLVITLNAWCFDGGGYLPELCEALVRGYQDIRPLSAVERANLFGHALFGAVRFTASRIRDYHLSPLPADKLVRKDYRTYLARARALSAMGPSGYATLLGL
ncbi:MULTISPECIES: homoserine kinase [Myxococcus]|uniref:Homoserine kinase n=1 Tax=Myxococcus llanfairpwllgwyngyllgogerychwyrndrobwllllantysiliogogogochensis TaxID=2590453 RepID=A0A540WQX3_9BACT|nr:MULTISPECIES: homoserine kinase [Myxococcus]NTX04212.1 homoserine kinase [Myxococcus sp. CA040A]NTX13168.1 homoserine kinase [Myxococcus sp. CA056]NTX36381.1 homoserine kinase [Myxococcus sp. CA033]TQF10824.1 homoserine kinase [Myxococcus llanfairpwllgwyngyllgogerychwyrndrobwllllantysiliogogogochensis]